MPHIQWVPGTLSGGKGPGGEADHSPPSNVEITNMGTLPVIEIVSELVLELLEPLHRNGPVYFLSF
jgi:hypothetical protein